MTTPSASIGTHRGTWAWNSSRAQNKWLNPAKIIAPASAYRPTVRARVVGGGAGRSDKIGPFVVDSR